MLSTLHATTKNTTIDVDQALFAAGRTPDIEGLGLVGHGIALSPKGGIVVDDRMRTRRTGIYAVGDVAGQEQFLYMQARRRSASRSSRFP